MMTTAERLRRRQRIVEFILVIGVIISSITQVVSNHRDDAQDRCRERVQAEQNATSRARSKIVEKRFQNIEMVIDRSAGAKTGEDVRKALDAYVENRGHLKADLQANPIPPNPTGKCD
jgi:uncharacterized membrane protein